MKIGWGKSNKKIIFALNVREAHSLHTIISCFENYFNGRIVRAQPYDTKLCNRMMRELEMYLQCPPKKEHAFEIED